MKKNILYLLVAILTLQVLHACSDDDDFHPSIIADDEEAFTELDQWVYNNYTNPHNIQVLYRWEDFEANQALTLTPAKEEKVKPFLQMIQMTWIKPYIEYAGVNFFNSYCPKQVMLVGSVGYNDDGLVILGEAEGSHKITMYDINHLDPTDPSLDSVSIASTVFTVTKHFHHEFTHILHQKVKYPEQFELISASEYTTAWSTINPQQTAFITNYAGLDADEDFAEMVAYYLIRNQATWDAYLTSGRSDENIGKLRQKERIMKQYMKREWKIDMDEMREKVMAAMAEARIPSNYN